MKFFMISLLYLLPLSLHAEGLICQDTKADPLATAQEIVKVTQNLQMDPTGCEPLDQQMKSKKDFEAFAKKNIESDKIILARDNPNARTANSVTYKFPAQALKPGEAIYLWVPSDLEKRGVDFVVLGHRQNPQTETGTKPGEKWDQVPGLTSVQIFDNSRGKKSGWRYWDGMTSGNQGAKFAEVGSSFEMEGLYEWSQKGHTGVDSGDTANDDLKPKYVKIVSVGKDPVEISELTLKTNMADSDFSEEKTFTSGTQFGSQKTGQGYNLKNGQKNQGLFPDSIPLRHGGSGDFNTTRLPKGWRIENGDLVIPLKKGKVLANIEIAGGDAHPDKITNEDDGWGTKGWSKLSVFQKHADGSDTLMDRENVPPEGFLKAAPTRCGRTIDDGEYLIIRADSDTTYLAGIKLNYKSPGQ